MTDVTAVKAEPRVARKEATLLRRKVFVERWLTNGNNATEAAIYAGYSAHSANVRGSELLATSEVQELIGSRAQRLLKTAELSTERWAKEMAAIAHLDPGELYDGYGELIPVHLLPEHVRRAVASVEHETRMEGKGPDRVAVTTQKVKLNDKNTALANVGRHLGVFDKDNAQRITAVQVNVTFLD